VKNQRLLDLGSAMSDWNALYQAAPGQRAASLPNVVTDLNAIATAIAPAPPGQSGPVTAAKNPNLTKAIAFIRDKIVIPLQGSDPALLAVLTRSFGGPAVAQAMAMFSETLVGLEKTLSRTNDKGAGFVLDPGMPSSMGALARGNGDSSVIYVSSDALHGVTDPSELAAVLAHEGSHTLAKGATVDIAYRSRDAHFCLPPAYTVLNAANFEQVAREVLTAVARPTDNQAAAMHELAVPPLTLTLALLSSRVTRAWVRAYDLRSPDGRTGGSLQGLPTLPANPKNSALVDSLLQGLFSGMEVLLDLVNGNVMLGDSATADAVSSVSTPQAFTVTFPRQMVKDAGPPALAEAALGQVLKQMGPSWSPYTPEQLGSFVMGIERLDRPELRDALKAYYGEFAQGKKLSD
jgi:Peptidase family M48